MQNDRMTSIFLFVFAILFCIKSYQFGLGHLRDPGTGFIPFFSGVLLGCLSLSIFIKSMVIREKRSAFGGGWMKGAWVIGSLILYVLVLEKLGFLVTTFIFLILSLLSFQPSKFLSAFLVSLFTVLVSYLVFSLWLKVQLPKGILGI